MSFDPNDPEFQRALRESYDAGKHAELVEIRHEQQQHHPHPHPQYQPQNNGFFSFNLFGNGNNYQPPSYNYPQYNYNQNQQRLYNPQYPAYPGTDSGPGFLERVGSFVLSPFRWAGRKLGILDDEPPHHEYAHLPPSQYPHYISREQQQNQPQQQVKHSLQPLEDVSFKQLVEQYAAEHRKPDAVKDMITPDGAPSSAMAPGSKPPAGKDPVIKT